MRYFRELSYSQLFILIIIIAVAIISSDEATSDMRADLEQNEEELVLEHAQGRVDACLVAVSILRELEQETPSAERLESFVKPILGVDVVDLATLDHDALGKPGRIEYIPFNGLCREFTEDGQVVADMLGIFPDGTFRGF